MADAQRLLLAVEHWALAVGLRINKKKTEYMRLGDISSCTHPPLRVLAGEIAEVDNTSVAGWLTQQKTSLFVVLLPSSQLISCGEYGNPLSPKP